MPAESLFTKLLMARKVAIAEAAEEGRLIAHFEDLLNILKLKCALANIILGIEWIIDARHLVCLIHGDLRDQAVEIV